MRGRPPKWMAAEAPSNDYLDLLRQDPGTRTLGQLLQERQWAVGEIERLRRQLNFSPQTKSKVVEAKALGGSSVKSKEEAHSLIYSSEVALLSAKQLRSSLGVSNASLYKWTAEGKFPRPIKLGERTTRWRAADVRDWLEHNAGGS